MTVNVSEQYNGEFLPEIILLTQGLLLPSGNPFQVLWKRFCICSLSNNNFIHVVETQYIPVVKRKCISHQLQYFNVFCVLDYKPLMYKGRWHYYY